jgi:hypothetical protein
VMSYVETETEIRCRICLVTIMERIAT